MAAVSTLQRRRLDQAGIWLSGLCAAHCLVTVLFVSSVGVGAHILLEPVIHKVGLLLAALIAAIAIGWGAVQHGRRAPLAAAGLGLALMAAAVMGPHGFMETALSAAGVSLVALGHALNLRPAR